MARERHGPVLDRAAVEAVLADRGCVRFPTGVVFDDHAPAGGSVEPVESPDGPAFEVRLPTRWEGQEAAVAVLVPRLLPRVSYGRMPNEEDGIAFAAALLGLEPEAYRARLAELLD